MTMIHGSAEGNHAANVTSAMIAKVSVAASTTERRHAARKRERSRCGQALSERTRSQDTGHALRSTGSGRAHLPRSLSERSETKRPSGNAAYIARARQRPGRHGGNDVVVRKNT